MCYLFNSGCLVVVFLDGFVDILGIQTNSQLAICFPGVGEWGYPSLWAPPVGWWILVHMNSSSFSHTSGHIVIGHFHGACMMGFASLHRVMWYVPGKQPIPLNLSRYALMRFFFGVEGWRFQVLKVLFDCSTLCCGFLLLHQLLLEVDCTVEFHYAKFGTWWESKNCWSWCVCYVPSCL